MSVSEDFQYRLRTIISLNPNIGIGGKRNGNPDDYKFFVREGTMPTEEEIQDKIIELKKENPFKLMRNERDKKLKESDNYCQFDHIFKNEQHFHDFIEYRQKLRDVPQNNLNPEANLTKITGGVEWPTKPDPLDYETLNSNKFSFISVIFASLAFVFTNISKIFSISSHNKIKISFLSQTFQYLILIRMKN